MPFSLSLYNRYRAPMSCYINPINSDLEYTPQAGSGIPRCSSCRAYMNYYNEATRKYFKCFFCGRENNYEIEYNPENAGVELSSPNYLVDGPNGYIFYYKESTTRSLLSSALFFWWTSQKRPSSAECSTLWSQS